LGIAVLKFFHNFTREGAAAGDLGEVFGHLAEGVGGSMGEEKDGGLVGLGHGLVHPIPIPTPWLYTHVLMMRKELRARIYDIVYISAAVRRGIRRASGPVQMAGWDTTLGLLYSLL
jgi:hypothetical protein